MLGGVAAGRGCSATLCSRTVKRKVEPFPSTLSTWICPPISSTSCLEMVRPRPVPPNRRVVEPSAWRNDSKIRGSCSGLMPMPVSFTANSMTASSPLSSITSTRSDTSPAVVNLMALPIRLTSTWRSLPASPKKERGRSGGSEQAISRPLRWAPSAQNSLTSSARSRRSKTAAESSIRPASILEKSRMSLMIASSASAELRMVWVKRRWRSFSEVPASSSAMPRTPFIGVRISWLMLARNCDLARLASSAASRARARSCTMLRSSAVRTATSRSSSSRWRARTASRFSISVSIALKWSISVPSSSWLVLITRAE